MAVDTSVVRVGSTVTVLHQEGDTEKWEIVPAGESDLAEGRIGEDTPLAKAVLRRSIGERVPVQGPNGHRFYVQIQGVAGA